MVNNNRGFVLYIIMGVLMVIGMLGLALNTFKRGSVRQLSRTIDQNRLIATAQSANAETLAMLKTLVNSPPPFPVAHNAPSSINDQGYVFRMFRKPFEENSTGQWTIIDNYVPQETMNIAQTQGYQMRIKSKAVLSAYYSAPSPSINAYKGHIDIYSQAWIENFQENTIEIHERREVKFKDMRHNLDRYALFVKNYSPDYNNTRRRISIQGIPEAPNHISRAYLGIDNYPENSDGNENIWMDLNHDEQNQMQGFWRLFGANSRTSFDGSNAEVLFNRRQIAFSNVGSGLPTSDFYYVPAIIDVYEKFVNQAADGIFQGNNRPAQPYATGQDLRTKAQQAMNLSDNPNSAAYQICEDFVSNANFGGGQSNYSQCTAFDTILNSCFEQWQYHYGYADSEALWRIADVERPMLPPATPFARGLRHAGIASETNDLNGVGAYFFEYSDGTPPYNPERARIGQMPLLYGPNSPSGDINRVLVEGPVYLRFFKVAFFDSFSTTLPMYQDNVTIEPEPVPLLFQRDDRGPSFLNRQVQELSVSSHFTDRALMSKAIDHISVNALLGDQVSFYDGDGNTTTIDPMSMANVPTFVNPIQPSGSNALGRFFGRRIDFRTISWQYACASDFIEERVREVDGNKTLFIDGLMFIESGPLDLTDVTHFRGKGMIYVARGHCHIGNFERKRNPYSEGRYPGGTTDSLRIYLRQGSFILDPSNPDIIIEASLSALYQRDTTPTFGSPNRAEQGTLVYNNHNEVLIHGNLHLDFLYTQDSSGRGLADGGWLHIIHDPVIYDPDAEVESTHLDPYQVSISPVRSLVAVNAGGASF